MHPGHAGVWACNSLSSRVQGWGRPALSRVYSGLQGVGMFKGLNCHQLSLNLLQLAKSEIMVIYTNLVKSTIFDGTLLQPQRRQTCSGWCAVGDDRCFGNQGHKVNCILVLWQESCVLNRSGVQLAGCMDMSREIPHPEDPKHPYISTFMGDTYLTKP